MCGIFTILNNDNYISADIINQSFEKGKNRGPEHSSLNSNLVLKTVIGFHRLAINGLTSESDQPLFIDNVGLICNGEIYNYKELYKQIDTVPSTASDCEIIIHLYIKYGIDQTLRMIDGEFSFILFDNRISKHDLTFKIFVARDPYGVRPLYYLSPLQVKNNKRKLFGFASELKCLSDIYNQCNSEYTIEQFKPGTYSEYNLSNAVQSFWEPVRKNIPHCIPAFSYSASSYACLNIDVSKTVSYYLNEAVIKRCANTERPVACLLSGGLDSSLVTALANDYYKKQNSTRLLETYSIGLQGSEDLRYARIVADYLGTKHTEIVVTEQEMFDAIPEVICAIESYDTTTVRASIGNYLLGKYISQNSEAKVILNGDGSDEVCGGYLYMHKCPDNIEFDKETTRLLRDIHTFDVLRSDKSISSHGLEPRTPFLDRSFVNNYLSMPIVFRNHTKNTKNERCEKFLLRNSFDVSNYKNYEGKSLLPDQILWRKKEAFSDGVTSNARSLFEILQEKIMAIYGPHLVDNKNRVLSRLDHEKHYYKSIFEKHFPNLQQIIPYYWMPKYTNAMDPSAKTLDIYSV